LLVRRYCIFDFWILIFDLIQEVSDALRKETQKAQNEQA